MSQYCIKLNIPVGVGSSVFAKADTANASARLLIHL